ncbi:hypothetical protein KIL84_001668 [Mauremys mutica]|uniref:Uncharacterized protein n=1 Tax=Mauremys mutica TaxID=74926 RepID=A0A9D4B531_9SAUR|nr:hypothetical protein KIL84_001668 [Mauremys mutica]
MKIDKERQLVVLEEEFQDISPEELKSELPERQPRYPSAVGQGGGIRVTWWGAGIAHGGRMPGVCMRDACVFEIRTTEDLTEEWLRERLAFFR